MSSKSVLLNEKDRFIYFFLDENGETIVFL